MALAVIRPTEGKDLALAASRKQEKADDRNLPWSTVRMGRQRCGQPADLFVGQEALAPLPAVSPDAPAGVGPLGPKAHRFRLPHDDGKHRHGAICRNRRGAQRGEPVPDVVPAATAEAWIDGHVHAFAFFGGVPRSVLYDNDRCLVSRILADGTRRRARLFGGFLSHYLVRDRYGRPGKGNDKGAVEGLVGFARRNFMVPLPRFASWEAFNRRLEEQCRRRQGAILRGHRETIGERLVRDLEAMSAPPAAPFEACAQAPGQVSSQSLVRYETNDYSVPVAYVSNGAGQAAAPPRAAASSPRRAFPRHRYAHPHAAHARRAQEPVHALTARRSRAGL